MTRSSSHSLLPVVIFTRYDKTAILLNVAFYRHNTTTNIINDINNKIQLLIMLMLLIEINLHYSFYGISYKNENILDRGKYSFLKDKWIFPYRHDEIMSTNKQ
jgi:hypothetical protein